MRLDLNPLRIFLEAARVGNYTKAGQRLNLSQSAVSHAIGKLEEGLERPLVEWRARRFSLTAEGRYLYEVCERVFRELEAAELRLATGGDATVRVVLGATVEFGTTVLVRRMRPLLQAHGRLHIDFHFSNNLADQILSGEVDLAVDCKPHAHPGLESTYLFREKYVVIASPDYLSDHPVATVEDLALARLLSLDREATWWDNFFKAIPPEERQMPQRVMEVTHVRGIINAAATGLGVGLVPKYTVISELDRGELVELFPGMQLLDDEFRIWEWSSRAERPQNRLVKAFLESMDASEFGDAIKRT